MTLIRDERCQLAERLAREAGTLGLAYFNNLDVLEIDRKGHQDLVSEADKALEHHIRTGITAAFPQDAILGEEDGYAPGDTAYVWVIDPIDGTANFVSGIPAWTVVITLVEQSRVMAGFIYDPVLDVMFRAYDGEGAFRNNTRMSVAANASISTGSVAVGFSNRSKTGFIEALVSSLVAEGGVFFRNASGALSLAYVADGRLIGYSEDHMNAWDYLAGQLMVREAGGSVEMQDIPEVLQHGGRVIAAAPPVFAQLVEMTERAMA